MIKKYSFAFLFIILFMFGCSENPERDNPLDPHSNLYRGTAALSGTVYTAYPPFQPIPNVHILTIPGYHAAFSEETGNFHISDIPIGEYKVIAAKTGYSSDTLSVHISNENVNTIDFHLDALPQFSEIEVYSNHISQWWPTNDIYYLQVRVTVSDKDGLNDISAVTIHIPKFNFVDTLQSSSTPGIFQDVYREDDLPIAHIQGLVGYPIYFKAFDRSRHYGVSESSYITRVIEATPVASSPQGLEFASPTPTLKWQVSSLPYPHSFTVTVFRDDAGVISTVWEKSGLNSERREISIQDSLLVGNYFWTVSILDNFGNRSRSKEAAFRVK
ncbi:MAG: carboxypeptidase regulatory-like domain-containing protein [Calditrichaeota bacterium]|nr:carboxypeptidase regulatory-like domain-containing protein [Calditrichota bacterium]